MLLSSSTIFFPSCSHASPSASSSWILFLLYPPVTSCVAVELMWDIKITLMEFPTMYCHLSAKYYHGILFLQKKKKKKKFFCQTYISRLPLNFSLSIHVESTKMKSRLLPVHLHWPAFIVQNDNIYLSFLIHTFLFTNIQLVLRSCCFSPCTSDNCLFLSVHGTNMPLLTLMSRTLFLCTELKELLWIHDLLDHA